MRDYTLIFYRRTSDGKCLLLRRRKPPYAGFWNLPGGKVEPEDESLAEAAWRELWEETALVAEPVLRAIFDVRSPDGSALPVRLHVFTAEGRGDGVADACEEGELAWFDLTELASRPDVMNNLSIMLGIINGLDGSPVRFTMTYLGGKPASVVVMPEE